MSEPTGAGTKRAALAALLFFALATPAWAGDTGPLKARASEARNEPHAVVKFEVVGKGRALPGARVVAERWWLPAPRYWSEQYAWAIVDKVAAGPYRVSYTMQADTEASELRYFENLAGDHVRLRFDPVHHHRVTEIHLQVAGYRAIPRAKLQVILPDGRPAPRAPEDTGVVL